MKEDVLVCPFCGQHSHSKLTTNISDDSIVRCNYCENQFRMGQARVAVPTNHQQHPRRTLQTQTLRKQATARAKLKAASSEQRTNRLQLEYDRENESASTDRNELAMAAFVTSLVAFLLGGCLSPISLVFAIFALERAPRGMAAAALVLSLAGLVPMTTVTLPVISKVVLNSVDKEVVLIHSPVAEERASSNPSTFSETQSSLSNEAVAQSDTRNLQEASGNVVSQNSVAKSPALRFSDIKQGHTPLGGIGIYLTAENVSDIPVSHFEAIVEFIDQNGEVVAQDKIRETFFYPIPPGTKRSLLFSPGIYSELRNIVPNTCRGSATLLDAD